MVGMRLTPIEKRLPKARLVVQIPVIGLGDAAPAPASAQAVHVGYEHHDRGQVLAAGHDANSPACLIALMVSPPPLASPMILALEACACSRNDEKSAC